jgi:pimeloyl-ACP methyl ester carboxylesterase
VSGKKGAMTTTRVTSADGVRLAVYESGPPSAPTIVAIHGYPDNHAVWTGVVDRLAEQFHVVTYDVRGAGASDKPAARSAYRMPRLIGDLHAVLDTVSPTGPVHLVGHDWGSIQGWAAVTDERLAGRIAGYTSISGPSIDYSTVWLRDLRAHPTASLRQLAHSYYIALFQLPGLAEVAVRGRAFERRLAALSGEPGRRAEADKVNGLSLYRANMLGRVSRPAPKPTDVPVLLIVPERDPFVTPDLAIGAPRPWVADLTVRRLPAGHWVISKRPDVVAGLIGEFVHARSTAP